MLVHSDLVVKWHVRTHITDMIACLNVPAVKIIVIPLTVAPVSHMYIKYVDDFFKVLIILSKIIM